MPEDDGVQLTAEKVLAVSNKRVCSEVVKVNAFALGITKIDDLQCFANLSVLSLSSNSVNDISGLRYCYSLVEVYLRKNNVSDLRQIGYLQNLKNLNVLFLADNPCSQDDKYRLKVTRCLKFLSTLDVTVITDADKSEALNSTNTTILAFEESIKVFLDENKDKIKPESKDIGSTVFKGLQSMRSEAEPSAPVQHRPAGHHHLVASSSSRSPNRNILDAIKLLMEELSTEDISAVRALCDERLLQCAITVPATGAGTTAESKN